MNVVLRSKGYHPEIEETEFRLDEFKSVIQFMKASNLPFVAIIGKNPTAHPQYFDFIEMCIKEGVYVRTALDNSDVLDEDIIERLAQLASNNNGMEGDDKVGFLLDLTKYSDTNTALAFTLKKLSRWSVGSVTLGQDCEDLQVICEKMVESGMLRILRVGFSLPAPDNEYTVLPLENYEDQIKKLVAITDYRRKHEIGLVFNCGMPVCKFEKAEIGELYTSPMSNFEFICAPKPEILPGLKVVYCSALAGETVVNLSDFKNFRELLNYLGIYFKNYTSAFEACVTCQFKGKLCGGGCKGYNLNKK